MSWWNWPKILRPTEVPGSIKSSSKNNAEEILRKKDKGYSRMSFLWNAEFGNIK